MVNRFLVAVLVGSMLAVGIGCGGVDDESQFQPTPTQGPPTPTPLVPCKDIPVPSAGLGCRPFTWTQPTSSTTSGSQLFTTLPDQNTGGFNFLPALVQGGLDPGGNFVDLPPGLALVAGPVDPLTGVAAVTIGVAPKNQLEPGFVIIGFKPLLDYVCLKIELETVDGSLFCDGSDTQGVDTRITSASGITMQADDVIESSLGDSTVPGSLVLRVIQQQGRIDQASDPRYETCLTLPECGPGERLDCYRPRQEVFFTSGTVFGMKGDTPLLNAQLAEGISGEPFDCASWTTADGPGQLAQGLADTEMRIPAPGDVATAFRIDD